MTSMRDRIGAFFGTRRGFALLLLVTVLSIVLPGQASIPPLDRDESRFAQATRQMLETGDFVDIRFQDAPRHLQPAGIYWVQAAAVSVFGDAEQRDIWPHRVPSWLSAVAIAFLTWWVGALLFGAQTGRLAGLLMGASFLLSVEAHIAKIDATLCLATLLSQAALAKIYLARNEARLLSWWAALYWSALGFGVLLKGPIILLVAAGTLAGLVLMERRTRWLLKLQPLWGAPLMLLLAAPWYIAIGVVTNGDFFRTALGYSVVGKLTESHQAHGGPPGYHAALWPLMFWPGSLFAALAVPFAWAERRSDPVRFCLAWIVPAWLVFEFSGTKLPHYTLPLLPAFAVLAAAFIERTAQQKFLGRPRLFKVSALAWLAVGLVPAALFTAIALHYQGSAPVLSYVLAAACLAFMLAALWFLGRGRGRTAVAAAVASAVVAAGGNYQLIMPQLDTLFISPRIATTVANTQPCTSTRVISPHYHEPSLVFLRDDILYPNTVEEAAAFAAADPLCSLVVTHDRGDAVEPALARHRLALSPVTTLSGYNYNEGDDLSITVSRVTPIPTSGGT